MFKINIQKKYLLFATIGVLLFAIFFLSKTDNKILTRNSNLNMLAQVSTTNVPDENNDDAQIKNAVMCGIRVQTTNPGCGNEYSNPPTSSDPNLCDSNSELVSGSFRQSGETYSWRCTGEDFPGYKEVTCQTGEQTPPPPTEGDLILNVSVDIELDGKISRENNGQFLENQSNVAIVGNDSDRCYIDFTVVSSAPGECQIIRTILGGKIDIDLTFSTSTEPGTDFIDVPVFPREIYRIKCENELNQQKVSPDLECQLNPNLIEI